MRYKPFFVLAAFLCLCFASQKYFTPSDPNKLKELAKRPSDWFFMQRAFPYDDIDKAAHLQAVRQAQASRALFKGSAAAPWRPIGPSNIGGRITAMAVHPTNANTIYIGAAVGGVFKSTDGGANWTPIFDEQPSLSIGALAIDPVIPETIYVGTGEANSSGDSYAGDGIYKSTDGGQTWANIGLVESDHIGRIAIHPRNSNIIYVAACGRLFGKNDMRGIFKSTDAGKNWQRMLFISDSTAAIDVALNPQQPDTVYAAMWERLRSPYRRKVGGFTTGLYRSDNGGANWRLLTTGLPASSPNTGRIGIAVAPSNPQTVYAIYADDPGNFAGVYKSTNHGDTWQRTTDGALSGLFSNFGWYFGNIKVDPANANIVYALGVSFYQSTTGGQSWTNILRSIHVDQHAIDFDPSNSQRVFVGNDGGFYVSTNRGASWTKSFNLPITQFYAGTIDFLNPQRSYGGTQDNGTIRTLSGSSDDWQGIYGGDGFYVLVDPTDARYVYAESQYGGLGRSTDGGFSFFGATNGIASQDRKNWSTPVVLDPQNPRTLYYGANRLYRSRNRAVSWTPISSDLTNGSGPANLIYGTITTIAVSPSDSNLIYVGTDDANVWVTRNSGQNWLRINNGLPRRWVTRVEADAANAQVAYATFSGHASGSYAPHIFRTTNQGTTWTDISGNLPPAPINDVVIDPLNNATLYIGADVGVFYTTNLGANWQPLGSGMPFTPVHDLTLHARTRQLRAATHGRSFYEFDLNTVTAVTAAAITPPEAFALQQNYPNPIVNRQINPVTTIAFQLHDRGKARLEIFDMLGRRIAVPVNEILEAGWHQRQLSAAALPSGNYVYRLSFIDRSGKQIAQSRKFEVIK
jgi:photosystem II stability/assembly factor-like uncharacterized protein